MPATRRWSDWIATGEDPIAWLRRHADIAHTDHTTCVTKWYAGDRS